MRKDGCPNCKNKEIYENEKGWIIEVDGGMCGLEITFCPFCGVKLLKGICIDATYNERIIIDYFAPSHYWNVLIDNKIVYCAITKEDAFLFKAKLLLNE